MIYIRDIIGYFLSCVNNYTNTIQITKTVECIKLWLLLICGFTENSAVVVSEFYIKTITWIFIKISIQIKYDHVGLLTVCKKKTVEIL